MPYETRPYSEGQKIGNSAELTTFHQPFPSQRVFYKCQTTFSECGGSIRVPGYRVGYPKECVCIYVANPRKGIDWKTEGNKGQVVYFVKPQASYSVVAEDKKSKLAEMVGGGSA